MNISELVLESYKENLRRLVGGFIDRSQGYIADAEDRADDGETEYYKGQLKAFEEFKKFI